MQKVITATALAVGLFLAFGASAQDTETSNDLKCVALLSFSGSQQTDPTATMAAGMGVIYFLGRIEGRVPGFNVENGLRHELGKLTGPKAMGELNRCAATLKSKAEELQAIGRSLESMPDLNPDT